MSPDERAKIKFRELLRWPLRKYHQWGINKAVKALDDLDRHIYAMGWDRRKRRQFWRDFCNHRRLREGAQMIMKKEVANEH